MHESGVLKIIYFVCVCVCAHEISESAHQTSLPIRQFLVWTIETLFELN